MEGLGEVLRDEDGEVGIVRLALLIAVPVDDGKVVVVIFLRDEAARVLAESAHLVFEGVGIADELGLVEHLVDGLHDLVAHFDPHADIDGSRDVGDAVHDAHARQPVRASSSDADDDIVRFERLFVALLIGNAHAPADIVLDEEVEALRPEAHLDAVLKQILLDGVVELLRLLGAEVADGAVDELQARHDGAAADVFDLFIVADAFHFVVCAEGEIDLIGIVDELLRVLLADEIGKVAAHFVVQGELAVRKGARARKARRDVAGLAGSAVARPGLGALAVFDGGTLLNDEDGAFVALVPEFERREDARGACAHDDGIVFHTVSSALRKFRSGCFLNRVTPSVCFAATSLLYRVPAKILRSKRFVGRGRGRQGGKRSKRGVCRQANTRKERPEWGPQKRFA